MAGIIATVVVGPTQRAFEDLLFPVGVGHYVDIVRLQDQLKRPVAGVRLGHELAHRIVLWLCRPGEQRVGQNPFPLPRGPLRMVERRLGRRLQNPGDPGGVVVHPFLVDVIGEIVEGGLPVSSFLDSAVWAGGKVGHPTEVPVQRIVDIAKREAVQAVGVAHGQLAILPINPATLALGLVKTQPSPSGSMSDCSQ